MFAYEARPINSIAAASRSHRRLNQIKPIKLRGTQWNYPDYYSYRTYRGARAINYYQYQEGTLILDFVEPFSKTLIWHGSARVAIDYANTPEKREKLIKEAMQKILQNYPPPSE
jgi:hypothetical protein